MNVIKALYCNQYYELKPKGKEHASLQNGTALVTIALLVNFFAIVFFVITISPDVGDYFGDIIEDIFGRRNGRSLGKILGIIPFGLIYLGVKNTTGKEANYNQTITEFEALSPDQQKQVSKKGLNYFIISIVVFAVAFALFFIV